ncbi:sialidase family protein [Rubritalea tangerina]|uniref:exo-alpha-sialidase n=1 Tax=Rubritalea tangerina TaxID=430798 RepID=A0ABW4ZEA2_9BACT
MKAILIAGSVVTAACLSHVAAKDTPKPKIVKISSLDELKVKGKPGLEKEYKYFREPNAVVTKNGTLLVTFGPHHVRGKNDRAHQDMLLKRSSDSGKTWSDVTLIADHGMNSVLPTTLVYDEIKDRVLLVYNIIFNDPDSNEKKPCQQFMIYSDDEGLTWSKPKEILPDLGGICVFGGSNGLQVKHGKNKGQLIIPGGCGSKITWFSSSDHGVTWRTRDIGVKNKGRKEATACETPDGKLHLFHRTNGFGMLHSTSSDGGATWTPQQKSAAEIWASCNNSALTFKHNGTAYLALAGPVGPEHANKIALEEEAASLVRGKEDSKQSARCNGAIFLSSDGGKTFPHKSLLTPGWICGYNGLVHLPDGNLGFIFEGANKNIPWNKIKGKADHNTGAALGIYMAIVHPEWILKNSKN